MDSQIQQTQPNQQPSINTAASSVTSLSSARCQARNRNGSRCRLRAQDTATCLCARHADRAGRFADVDDSLDLSKEVFANQERPYDSAASISSILSNVVELVAQGRISPRRAAVITYALSLMLRSAVVAERQAPNRPAALVLPDWWLKSHPVSSPTAQEQQISQPTTPAGTVAAYERLRS